MVDTINPHERRAQALAEITQMQQDLVTAHARIQTLENTGRDRETSLMREIHKQEARAEIAEQDRAKYRAEAHLYRGKLVEMVTTIANVRKMTDEAEKIKETVNSLLSGNSTEDEEREQQEAKDIVSTLPARIDHSEAIGPELESELNRLSKVIGLGR